MGQQLQTFLFGSTDIDPNTLINQTLHDMLQDETEISVIALPRSVRGTDTVCAGDKEACLFYCSRQHNAVFTLSPCGHRVLCYSCYHQFIEQPTLRCPICHSLLNGIN
jgi:hypothetical protein